MSAIVDTERYFIASVPPSPYFQQALDLKNYFKSAHQSKAALNSPPHITLHMPFEWKVKSEDRLTTSLGEFFDKETPVDIELKGFGCFAPRVIFINVADSPALTAMQKRLTQLCRRTLNLFNADYQDHPFHAHMTIAFRDLKKTAFESAWKELQLKTFEGKYSTGQISLLKHTGTKWEIFRNFDLRGRSGL